MKRLLVTGGSSFLGTALLAMVPTSQALAVCYWQNRPETSRPAWSVDLRDGVAVMGLVKWWGPEVIIHLAGSNRSASMSEVIEVGTKQVVAAAAAVGARLLFMSTDVIFDGQLGPYDEAAVGRPLHPYGIAKMAAEGWVRAYEAAVIIRTSLIYDPYRWDHGTQWIAHALQTGAGVTLFTNQWRNPIDAATLATVCLELAEDDYVGVLHVAGEQMVTRAAYTLQLLDWFGIKERATLSLGEADGKIWPLDTRLDIRRAQARLQTPLLGVDAVLAAARR